MRQGPVERIVGRREERQAEVAARLDQGSEEVPAASPTSKPSYDLSYLSSYMAVVSVRVDDDTLAILKAHDVNVSEVARIAFAKEAHRLQALDVLQRLRRLDLRTRGPPSEEVIRRSRGTRPPRG